DKGIVVSSTLTYSGSAPIAVDWQVSDRSGSLKMFNLFIEGVSMLATERSEIRALLEANRNSVDALIADLSRRG
ncbi:MAG: ABC transporter substrate-binding protein, partial [Pseudomonadota bacterium]